MRKWVTPTARLGLPRGAYKPSRESPEQAGVREVAEELGLTITHPPMKLETLTTTLDGKRDTLTIVRAVPNSKSFTLSPELTEKRWETAGIGVKSG